MNENAVVLFEKRGAAFWITINRPDKRNALRGDYSGLIIVLLCRTIIVGVVFGVARGAAESLELGSTGIENAMPLFCRGLEVCGATMAIICLYKTIDCSALSMMVCTSNDEMKPSNRVPLVSSIVTRWRRLRSVLR